MNENLDKQNLENVKEYFEKKLYLLNNIDIYKKEIELTNQIDQIRSNYPHNLINRDKQLDEDYISVFEFRIDTLEKQYNIYKEEAFSLIDKKHNILDFFNGTLKRDKDRLKELGVNINFTILSDDKYDIYTNANFNKDSLMYNISDEITLLKVQLHELDLARIKDQEITKIKVQIDNLDIKYHWNVDLDFLPSKEYLHNFENKILNEKESFETWIMKKDQNNDYIINTNSDIHNFLLLNGWRWQDWLDGSGSLRSPDDKSYFQYDLSTNEYKYFDSQDWDLFTNPYEDMNLVKYKEYAEKIISEKFFEISIDKTSHEKNTVSLIEDINSKDIDSRIKNSKLKLSENLSKNIEKSIDKNLER